MNAGTITATHLSEPTSKGYMKSPLIASLVFHVFLALLFSGAFFFFSKPVDIPMEAVAIEILPIAEKAESITAAPIAKRPKEPTEIEETPPPMPKAVEKKAAPKSDAPEPVPKSERSKIEEVKPKPLKKAPVPKAAPVPEKAPKKPPVAEKEEPKPEEKEEAAFSSILKNLVGEEEAPAPESEPRDTPRQAPQLTAPAPLGQQMSMTEMDALRSQLANCWNVLPGARDAATLIVDLQVTVTPAKIVQSARVIDQLRYSSDPFFRAAAGSALRALRSPTCTPLKLPDGKFEQWKNMTVRFDPKDMF